MYSFQENYFEIGRTGKDACFTGAKTIILNSIVTAQLRSGKT
jgi:hypothetical protein